jgi:hypothetical protein
MEYSAKLYLFLRSRRSRHVSMAVNTYQSSKVCYHTHINLIFFLLGKLEAFLIKYLGIPLSTQKLKTSDMQPLVDKISDVLLTVLKCHI